VSAGLALGIPLEALAKRLKSFIPRAPMRMEMRNLGGILFINDAYNASPTSMEAALETLRNLAGGSRKMAVLGDMLEMGDHSENAHRRVVKKAAQGPFQALALVGRHMKHAFGELSEADKIKTHWFPQARDAAAFLKKWAQKGDVVLLKGSRAMGLEKILERF